MKDSRLKILFFFKGYLGFSCNAFFYCPAAALEDDNRLGPSAAGGAGPDSQAARSQPSYSNPAVRSSKGDGTYLVCK